MPNGMYGGVRGEKKSPLLDLIHYFGFKERQNIIAACSEKFFGPIPYLADECFIIQIIPGAECFRNPIHAGQDKRCFNIVFVHNNRPF